MLTDDDVAAIVERSQGLCEVSGIEMTFTVNGRRGPYGPSVDRIDSNFAYTPRNTRIVCIAINYAMSTWGAAPLIRIAQAMAEKHRNDGRIRADFPQGAPLLHSKKRPFVGKISVLRYSSCCS